LQNGAVCCSVMRCAAALGAGRCSVSVELHRGAVFYACLALEYSDRVLQCIAVYCRVLQCVAVCGSLLQYVHNPLQSIVVTVCCSVLQRVAVCCRASRVLQCRTYLVPGRENRVTNAGNLRLHSTILSLSLSFSHLLSISLSLSVSSLSLSRVPSLSLSLSLLLCLSLSLCLSVCLSVYLSICLSLSLPRSRAW